jgi:hypothetical protein
MIPTLACNVPRRGARGKLSTIPVDISGDKIRSVGKIPLIRMGSLNCLVFRQLRKRLISKDNFMPQGQIIENIGLSVTLA